LVLETHGYKVLTAGDGAEAIALYVQNREHVRVVLTDMAMPIMDGAALARALEKINPDVMVIAASGLTDEEQALSKRRGSSRVVGAFLPKPYTTEQLLGALHQVLN
jgi:CheY-like chemotaxis protein